jgi:hypothetical protein
MIKFYSVVLVAFMMAIFAYGYLNVTKVRVSDYEPEETVAMKEFAVTIQEIIQKDPGFQIVSPLRDYYCLDYPSVLNCDWCFYIKKNKVDLDGIEDLLVYEEL